MNEITLTDSEVALLEGIAKADGISSREALHNAIFLFGMKVDYTENISQSAAQTNR